MMPDSAPGLAARHVFVYGTLRSGGSNDIARYSPTPVLVASGCIDGTLHDLGAYPGALLGGGGWVRGEIYRIDPDVEPLLDLLEDAKPDGSGEYVKREMLVTPDHGGTPIACLVYEIQPDRARGKPVIASGDWFDRG